MVFSPLDFDSVFTAVTGTRIIFYVLAMIAIAIMSAKWKFNNILFLMMFALFLVMMNAFGMNIFIVSLIIIAAIIGGWIFSKVTKT